MDLTDPEPIAARCPTEGICPPCREGFGHWRPEKSECPDCWVNGPHYCRAYGTVPQGDHAAPDALSCTCEPRRPCRAYDSADRCDFCYGLRVGECVRGESVD